MKSAITAILIIGVFIGFLSPFGMDEIPLQWSISYWLTTCTLGYIVYMPLTYYGDLLLMKVLPVHWCRIALSALVGSILMSFVVPIINWVFFSQQVDYHEQFWQVLPKTIVIGGALTFVSLIQDYLSWQKNELLVQKKLNEAHQQRAEKEGNLPLEKFLALLPIDKRGELYCLEMADHYVKVYTSQGHHLLLMRFKDALKLLENYPGLQTHRSWWVSKSAITALKKDGRKISLLLVNKLSVPVSRTYADNVKSSDIH
ncbi:LytTR family DNA-binding domain-containing protein [Colwellia piezophila]|uniref:LytTR family DNA-binding domain-containing protein n=1 Tax=Colwellia piezophila TaxID=211668 RepID=UPI00037B2949|nr:LytTR family DNA-binding domain-containing protein [Colwellia piezophila]